ncbi:hypothetical protein GCM10009119_29180 [Algoriphagus jejuensis]|uniref:Bifunctional isocitrate dehydrogenase kinase/phosphatase n=1 Tax=Algoriphagus jejuensis TaxID=419934 RepID=A0ABP3YFQ4_9BACT
MLIGFTACESSNSVKNERTSDPVSDAEMIATMQAQIDLGLAQKSAWRKHWSEKIGNFDASFFDLVFTDSIDAMEMPEKNPILEGDPLFPYQIPHPEGNGTMDIYSYKVEAQESLDHPFLNPDSEVIWYRLDGMRERLLFMGPSGMFEDGLWLTSQDFLVLGYLQEEAGFRPMVWLIDLETHRFSQFRMNQALVDYPQESYLDAKLKSVDLASDGF